MTTLRTRVAELLEQGLTLNEVARRTGVARATVGYHAARLRAASAPPPARREEPPVGVRRMEVATRGRVATLLAQGIGRAEVARRLGLTKSTVSYHARRLGEEVDSRCARRYDWGAVQGYYDLGHSVRECQARFGFSSASWTSAVKRGAITPRPAALPLAELLVAATYRGRMNLKARLFQAGLKEQRCERCGIADWRGGALSFALHHVNGDRHDNRLENLKILCPNCHSQTATFARRNGAAPALAGQPQAAACSTQSR
ncbi:MAG: helix-turn-helix domain-containing protein [Nocardioidaceae bacterium]